MSPAMAEAAAEISGDARLSISDRLRYLWRNAWRNLRASGGGIATRPFHARGLSVADIGQRSPSRVLIDNFVRQELPKRVPPARIDILDVGCASGAMMLRLAAMGYSGRYIGIDIKDNFLR